MGEMVGNGSRVSAGVSREVEAFLQRAATHPLGHEFVTRGSPDAVSATFGVHAFVVDAARAALRASGSGQRPMVEIPGLQATLPR